MAEPVDEYDVQQPKRLDRKEVMSRTNLGLDHGGNDERKELEDLNAEQRS